MAALLANKSFWIALAVAAGLVVAAVMYHSIFSAGETKVELIQMQEQKKEDTLLRKQDAKIDQSTPYDSSKSDAIKWLSKYTTSRH